MPQLSPEGRRVVEDVARRMGFSPDAVTSMLFSIVAGRGGMAQFNHPEFGGSGQSQDHQIGGFSQQQPGSGSLSFVSQLGPIDIGRLPVVSGADEDRASSEPIHKPAAEPNAVSGGGGSRQRDILAAIERLGELQARGILTEAEFSAKKAELLSRL